jgi:hypothetical protein
MKNPNIATKQLFMLRIILFHNFSNVYTGGADKSLARPTSRYILFDG